METSDRGAMALAVTEGLVETAYLDSVGVWTAGIGHTKAAGDPDPIKLRGKKLTVERMLEIFAIDLKKYEAMVNRNVKVPLNQHQFDALVHFVYNVGEGNFRKSNLLKLVNAKRYEEAGQRGFHGWLKPPELRGRRDKEREMFLEGNYGSTKAPLYTANIDGKLKRMGLVNLAPYFPRD